jgi:hypothetical protein
MRRPMSSCPHCGAILAYVETQSTPASIGFLKFLVGLGIFPGILVVAWTTARLSFMTTATVLLVTIGWAFGMVVLLLWLAEKPRKRTLTATGEFLDKNYKRK